jgi:glutathione S-transferase
MSKVQIVGASQSPIVWAVRMAALEKDIDCEFIDATPHSPEISAIQPFGKIPVMRHGDLTIGESRAIAFYIDGLHSKNPLVPRELAAAARVEQWIMHFHTEYVPLMLARYIVPYFFPQGHEGTPARNVIDAALPALQNSVAVLERQLNGRAYLTGKFTLADIFFTPTLYYASTLPEGAEMVAASMRLTAYLARITSRPAFKATLPPPIPVRAAA